MSPGRPRRAPDGPRLVRPPTPPYPYGISTIGTRGDRGDVEYGTGMVDPDRIKRGTDGPGGGLDRTGVADSGAAPSELWHRPEHSGDKSSTRVNDEKHVIFLYV